MLAFPDALCDLSLTHNDLYILWCIIGVPTCFDNKGDYLNIDSGDNFASYFA
jgi:hypothetical protein